MKAIINSHLILPQEILQEHVILFEDTIKAIIPREKFQPAQVTKLYDAQGHYLAPGFINMHIHGCAGFDAMDSAPDSVEKIAAALPATGVTAFLPTTMTCPWPEVATALGNIRAAQGKKTGARILGANLEGPFISKAKTGAQDPANIKKADFTLLKPFTDIIKITTIAPETLSDFSFIKSCLEHAIIVSLGHSAATYEEAMDAILAGATHMTHLFNAMVPLHHHGPGIVGAALDTPVMCELICDNIHVHPMLQRLVYAAKDPANIVLITDSMRACLLGDGVSELGGQKVFVKNGKATLADGSLAGSTLTLNKAVANFRANTGAPLEEVINMVTLNPAEELGLENKLGSLTVGKLADLVELDENMQVIKTWINGEQK